MGEKKDLTRIEDLSEFIHELNSSDEGEVDSSQVDSLLEQKQEDSSMEILSPDVSPSSNTVEEVAAFQEESPDSSFAQPDTEEVQNPPQGSLETSWQESSESENTQNPSVEQSPSEEIQESLDIQWEDSSLEQPPSEAAQDPSDTENLSQPISGEENPADGEDATLEESSLVSRKDQGLNAEAEESLDEMPSIQTNDVPEEFPPESSGKEEKTSRSPVKEMLEDVKDFAESLTYRAAGKGGNPPFSIILTGIEEEDGADVKNILREHGLLDKNNQCDMEEGLSRGSVIISQISEYAAIYLAHRMKRFDLKIKVGLSDQLHPSKSYGHDARGAVSRNNMEQNKTESQSLTDPSDVMIVTTQILEGYTIHRYLDVITEHSFVDKDEFKAGDQSRSCKDLAELLKVKAAQIKGNAVVGVNWHFDLIPSHGDLPERYKVVCSGSVVVAKKRKTISERTIQASRGDLRHS